MIEKILDKRYINIVDDCVSIQFQNFLLQQMHAPSLVWVFTTDVTNSTNIKNAGFSNTPYQNGTIISTAYWFLMPLLYEACSKAKIDVIDIIRMRVGIYVNRNTDKPNVPHIDSSEPHIVGLYYLDDFDGDTVFYTDETGQNEITRVEPKKGRMVLFDGSIYHASSNPVKSQYRTTINFNFTGNIK
jgi:hypothetical protein